MEYRNKLFRMRTELIKPTLQDVLGIIKGLPDKVGIRGIVEVHLLNIRTGIDKVFYSHNIVTNEGDKYYAQCGAQEAPTNDYTAGGCKLGTGTTNPAKGNTDIETDLGASYKGVFATYPKTDDGESANGGVDIVTYKFYWGAAEAISAGISEAAICSDNAAPPDGLLSRLEFGTPFEKTGEECLTLFIHHEMNGV